MRRRVGSRRCCCCHLATAPTVVLAASVPVAAAPAPPLALPSSAEGSEQAVFIFAMLERKLISGTVWVPETSDLF